MPVDLVPKRREIDRHSFSWGPRLHRAAQETPDQHQPDVMRLCR
jgi:hypothetical protein